MSTEAALHATSRALAPIIAETVRKLLETKHLYQSVSVESSDTVQQITSKLNPLLKKSQFEKACHPADWQWLVSDEHNILDLLKKSTGKLDTSIHVIWQAPDIKVFCRTCNRLEPYNRISSENFLQRSNQSSSYFHNDNKHIVQIYVLSYLCQSCKSIPEVFLIQRTGPKLILCGRSPFEYVQVPRCIPKNIRNYYSDAIVAFQSGQILSSLFMLRTLCEQWARSQFRGIDKADAVIDAYMQSLPEDFKNRFLSLRTIYSELSAALHAANPSTDLFTSTINSIDEHFEARKVFKIGDK